MNGYSELRLQIANDQIRELQPDAARQRLAGRARTQDANAASQRALGSLFGRSLHILRLAH
jgi:hypothetical protein